MLPILNLEKIRGQLFELIPIMDMYKEKNFRFVSAAEEWLERVQKELKNNNLSISAEIASLRGLLISTQNGLIPEGLTFHGRVSPRKIKSIAAAEILRKANEAISKATKQCEQQIFEAEKLALHIVSVAQAKQMLDLKIYDVKDSNMLKKLWASMTMNGELAAATTHLVGLVGVNDALILIDRAICKL